MRRAILCLSLVATTFGPAETCLADLTDYVVSNSGQFGTVKLQTGMFSSIGTTEGVLFGDITRLPGGPLYGVGTGKGTSLISTACKGSSRQREPANVSGIVFS
jgi:hypothetical protein